MPVMTESTEAPIQTSTLTENVIDLDVVNLDSILTHVSGYDWVVDCYYRQLVGDNQSLLGQSTTTEAVFQPYEAIEDLIIKVQTPITSAQDSETKEFAITGDGLLGSAFVPNKGDLILASLNDGKKVLLDITAVERKTHFANTLYNIAYKVRSYMTDVLYAELKAKTVKTVKFDITRARDSTKSLLTTEDQATISDYESMAERLLNGWMSEFYKHSQKTAYFKDSAGDTIYDPYMVEFIYSAIPEDKHYPKQLASIYSTSKAPKTILDVLLGHKVPMYAIEHTMTTSAISGFYANPILAQLLFSRLDSIVHPESCLPDGTLATKADSPEFTPIDGETPMPLVHDIEADDYYIFSGDFYNLTGNFASSIEVQAFNLANGLAMEPNVLEELYKEHSSWGVVERFYFIPMLYVMMNVYIREL